MRLLIAFFVFSLFMGLQPVRAQYQSLFHCQPPVGQQMFEIKAMNLTRAYREAPTPANHRKACDASREVVKVYRNAVRACSMDDCSTPSYLEICEKKTQKLEEWQENSRIICNHQSGKSNR